MRTTWGIADLYVSPDSFWQTVNSSCAWAALQVMVSGSFRSQSSWKAASSETRRGAIVVGFWQNSGQQLNYGRIKQRMKLKFIQPTPPLESSFEAEYMSSV